jgi:signal transduction histidine kinase
MAAFLSDFAQGLYRASPTQCRLDVSPELPDVAVGLTLRHQAVMAVKEALHNALKHAEAREVRLGIRYAAGTLRIRVDDDGKGFQLETGRRAGNGLASMQARMERISGTLEIISQPNRGTSVLFDIPISPHGSGTD